LAGYNNPYDDEVIIAGKVIKLDLHEVVIADILKKIENDKKLTNRFKYMSFDLYTFVLSIMFSVAISIGLFLALK
jgi:hypothetical protein